MQYLNRKKKLETQTKKVKGITVIRWDNKAKFPHWHRFPLHEKLMPKPKKQWETMKKKTYPEENERNEEKGRDQNYSFGRIPRANKRNRAINVRNNTCNFDKLLETWWLSRTGCSLGLRQIIIILYVLSCCLNQQRVLNLFFRSYISFYFAKKIIFPIIR